ncbi:protein unc-93 homolog A-like [Styela clava]
MDYSVKEARKKIRHLFYWKTSGVILAISSLAALQTLQTSINIEGNVGSISLTAGYITSILFSVFCCPIIIKRLGSNVGIVVADACYLVYCLSNFYPELGVLTFGAVVSGVARSLYFPTYTILIIQLATTSTDIGPQKSDGYYFDLFQSRFYTSVESVSIIGNGLSYSILYGISAAISSGSDETAIVPNVTATPNITTSVALVDPYRYCGVNDCQDPSVVSESIDQYVPPAKISVIVLITVASSLCISAVLIHALIYPGIGSFSHKLEQIKELVVNSNDVSIHVSNVTTDISLQGDVADNNNNDTDKKVLDTVTCYQNSSFSDDEKDISLNGYTIPSPEEKKKIDSSSITLSEDNVPNETKNQQDVERPADNDKKEEKVEKSYLEILKATGVFLIHPQSLMLSISVLHHGMMLGFVFADMTRAYASCVAGVETTGLFAIVFGAPAMLSANIYGKLIFPHRRYVLYGASCGLEFLLYVGCYMWVPDPDTIWLVYLLFAGFGLVNGIFRQNIVAVFNIHFSDNKDVAFSVFNVWFMGGLGVQYGLSTFMCVEDKLYTQVAVLVLGVVLFVVTELIYTTGKKNSNTQQDVENTYVEKRTKL